METSVSEQLRKAFELLPKTDTGVFEQLRRTTELG